MIVAQAELGQLFSALRSHQGKAVLCTLAFGDALLARVDMTLEDVVLAEGRLSLTGSFAEHQDRVLYREVALPLDEGSEIEVAVFAGEIRLTSADGFFLEVVPLDPPKPGVPYEGL
ncbi:MAG: hypothetical protein ACYCOS_07315 [Sulfobacillus sp.]